MPAAHVAPGASTRRLAHAFTRAAWLVSALGWLAEVMHRLAPGRFPVEAFSLSYEANVPTWYSSSLLLFCAAALVHAALARRGHGTPRTLRRSLFALGALFVLLSLDEAIELHEFTGDAVDGRGVLHFSWVIPGAIATAVVAAASAPLLLALDRTTRSRFLTAGAVYVAGALGCELPLGLVTEAYGTESLAYALVDWVEETLEMIGAGRFLVAILDMPAPAPCAPTADQSSVGP